MWIFWKNSALLTSPEFVCSRTQQGNHDNGDDEPVAGDDDEHDKKKQLYHNGVTVIVQNSVSFSFTMWYNSPIYSVYMLCHEFFQELFLRKCYPKISEPTSKILLITVEGNELSYIGHKLLYLLRL